MNGDTQQLFFFDFYSRRTTDVAIQANGWVVTELRGMNDSGVIAATATDPSTGQSSAVLLTPRP